MQTRWGSNGARSSGATRRQANSPGANLSTAASDRSPASFVAVYMPSHSVPELCRCVGFSKPSAAMPREQMRSEEHTSELQSRGHLVCRLLLEKKNGVHAQALVAEKGRQLAVPASPDRPQ